MAKGTISLTTTGGGNLSGQIVWESVSNGTAANTSEVTALVQLKRPANNWTAGTWRGSVTVGSTTVNVEKYQKIEAQWATIATVTATVSHNASGVGSCYLHAKINGPTGTSMSGTRVSGLATVTLDAIPRYASLVSVPKFNDEEDPKITFSNPAGNSVTTLETCISLDGAKADIPYRTITDPTGTSYTFPLTEAERNALRAATTDGNSRTVIFILRTTIGGTTGTDTRSGTFKIKNPKPTISPTVTDSNDATYALTGDRGMLVRYHSNAGITIGAAAVKKATLVSQKVTCGNQSLTDDGTIDGVESDRFVFTATDSRGNTVTKNVTVPFVEYVKLTCDLASDIPDGEGNMTVRATGNYFNASFGAKSNSLKVYYRYQPVGGTYTEWAEMEVTLTDNTYSAQANVTGLDYRRAYVFQTSAQDVLSQVHSAEKRVKATPVFDWSEDDFRFHVPVDMAGNKITSLSVPTDSADAVTLGFLNNLGLGAGGRHTEDLNNETTGGIVSFSSDCANAPFSYGVALVMRRYSSDVVQVALNTHTGGSGKGQICVRSYAGQWLPWEYLNPPMLPGIEYRTLARCNGLPVYRKLVSYRNSSTIGSASGVSSISIPHSISDFGSLVRVVGAVGNDALPYLSSSGGLTAISGVSSSGIVLNTNHTSWSSRDWLFDIAYTK